MQFEIRNNKNRDILSEKRESGMALKKREFTPESGTVDTCALSYSSLPSRWTTESAFHSDIKCHLWDALNHAEVAARRLFPQISPPLSIARYSFIQRGEK